MKLLVYNIAYGTGHTGSPYDRLKNVHKLIRTPNTIITKIANYTEKQAPDIIGLIEVDTGSSRTNRLNQVEEIARKISHNHISAVKYNKKHIAYSLPIARFQSNAVLSKHEISFSEFHFMPYGIKQLIIEVKIKKLSLFIVHLSIRKMVRKKQLTYLAKIAKGKNPLIIAGDFNTFSGQKELDELKYELQLFSANSSSEPTFPSYKPKMELDYYTLFIRCKTVSF